MDSVVAKIVNSSHINQEDKLKYLSQYTRLVKQANKFKSLLEKIEQKLNPMTQYTLSDVGVHPWFFLLF